MKAREVRAQEESVDYLSPGSRSATQSTMASMRSVGMVGKDMGRSSSHTFTIITQQYHSLLPIHQVFKSRIHDYDIDSPLRLLKATLLCIDDPANSSMPICVTARIRCRTQVE
jgi:hypothetical protein